jgi:regulator of cell morphogenesis and NO signaling
MNTTTATTRTVADIVRENSHAALVFESYGIDYCCNGRIPLAEACAKRGIDLDKVLSEVEQLPRSTAPDATQWPVDFLIDYIVNTHHQYVRTMLQPITEHAAKVAHRHGETHPETIEVADIFSDIRAELESHMVKEEQILFPYIKRLSAIERGDMESTGGGLGSVMGPISVMEAEHENVGRAYERIHALTNGLEIPPDACTTFTLLYNELGEFEKDLHMHIHLENNVLHPRAIAMEEAQFATK